MRNISEISDDLKQHAEQIEGTIIRASLNHDIWHHYHTQRTEYINVANNDDYNYFFRTSKHAHFLSCIIHLYTLFETKDKTRYSFHSLKKDIVAFKNYGDTRKIDELIDEAKPIWKKVSIIRNELFAHKKRDTDISEVFKKAELDPEDLGKLINISKEIMNFINKGLFNRTQMWNASAKSSTQNILKDLQNTKRR